MTHTTCPYCGANLDFGEKCDCQRENEKSGNEIDFKKIRSKEKWKKR